MEINKIRVSHASIFPVTHATRYFYTWYVFYVGWIIISFHWQEPTSKNVEDKKVFSSSRFSCNRQILAKIKKDFLVTNIFYIEWILTSFHSYLGIHTKDCWRQKGFQLATQFTFMLSVWCFVWLISFSMQEESGFATYVEKTRPSG